MNVINIGNASGLVYIKVCENPGAGNESVLFSDSYSLDPSLGHIFNVYATAPSAPGTWLLGVKVWGESESEPSWGSPGTMIIKGGG